MRRFLPYILALSLYGLPPFVENVHTGSDSTVFRIKLPGLSFEQRFMDSLTYDIIKVESGGFMKVEEGEPLLPQLRFDVALPGTTFSADFRVISDTLYTGIRPFPKTESIRIDEQRCGVDRWNRIVEPKTDIYNGDMQFPLSEVTVDTYLYMNEITVLNLYLTPAVFIPPNGLRYTRALEIAIEHPPISSSTEISTERLEPMLVNPGILGREEK